MYAEIIIEDLEKCEEYRDIINSYLNEKDKIIKAEVYRNSTEKPFLEGILAYANTHGIEMKIRTKIDGIEKDATCPVKFEQGLKIIIKNIEDKLNGENK
jgi:hypothetical protein